MPESVLASWKDGPAKRAILDFVATATTPGAGFVEPPDRIAGRAGTGATAAVQGTDRERRGVSSQGVAAQDPQLVETMVEGFARSWGGTTPEEFDAQVRDWTKTVKHPKLGVPYVELVYVPMLELFELLRANRFRVFVCSGGGRDFMRVFAEETWGIHKENVIGSAAAYSYVDGKIVRSDEAAERTVRAAPRPRRRGARVLLHPRRRVGAPDGQGARLDGREHEERLDHRLREGPRYGVRVMTRSLLLRCRSEV